MADTPNTPDQAASDPNTDTVNVLPPVPGDPTMPVEDMDETVPGGRYVVRGQTVDAEGNPVKGKK